MIDPEYLNESHTLIIELIGKYEEILIDNPLADGNTDLLRPIRRELLKCATTTVSTISELHRTLEVIQALSEVVKSSTLNSTKLAILRDTLDS